MSLSDAGNAERRDHRVAPDRAHLLVLIQEAATELRRLRETTVFGEPIDYALVLELELALADDAAAHRAEVEARRRKSAVDGGLEDGAVYGHPREGGAQ